MAKKDSKREKINFGSINEGKWKPLEIDWEARKKDQEKKIKASQERYEKESKEESARIENMECPCCKSTEKERFLKSIDNGICGPGYHSRITDDYYVCQGCGIHYTDLNKKDIKSPMSKSDFLF